MVASVTLIVLVLSASGWLVMLGAIAVLWVPAVWALYRSLSDEDRKLALLDEQGEIDTYSPGALAELREWVESNPEDPLAEEGKERYNDCVEILRRVDETFYDWSESDIESLEKL
jgi:hypothetical protein